MQKFQESKIVKNERSEPWKTLTPENQNKIKLEVKVEMKEEPSKDLHMVHDNSKQNANLTKDEENEENLRIKKESWIVEKGIDFVTSETFDEDFLKTAKIFEKDSSNVPLKCEENSGAMHQNQVMKSEVKMKVKEEPLNDLYMVHDNSKQIARLTKDEENEEKLEMKKESGFVEMGIDLVTSKTFDREYLKSTVNQEQEKTSQSSNNSNILFSSSNNQFYESRISISRI